MVRTEVSTPSCYAHPRMLTSQLDTRCPPTTTLAMTTAPPTRAPPLSEGCGLVHSCSTEGMWEAGDPTTTTTGLDDYAATTTVKCDDNVTTTPIVTMQQQQQQQ